jgi:2-polyprenyl-3-methyl-5-hydroxy-6-metoxy-1,4-benzoquinol methylase
MEDKLKRFCCPHCKAVPLQAYDNAYICSACAHRYPVLGGIPRFVEALPRDLTQVQQAFDFEHRRYQESWYTRFGPQLLEQFLDDCQLPAGFFRGLSVLDAGCGSGRWTYALAELGADVTAFDLTTGGVEVTYAQLGTRTNVTVCQADIFSLPFPSQSFDFVMSWGVLHHTPDTRVAFDHLVPLVNPGGTLYVMVYERHRPLMFFGTNVLRWFMRRLPEE